MQCLLISLLNLADFLRLLAWEPDFVNNAGAFPVSGETRKTKETCMRGTLLMLCLMAPLPALAQVHVVVPGLRVEVAPPAPRVEVRTVAPSPNHTWIDGHWAWRGNRHVWMGGHWVMPPGAGYSWVPARWVNEVGRWVFFEGHWRSSYVAAPTTVYEPAPVGPEPVYAEQAPPEPIVEVRSAVPFAGAVWIPGYWHWHGRSHMWVGGHWSAPREGYRWETARWEREGGRYRYVAGGWRR